jgi:hypothetical protein
MTTKKSPTTPAPRTPQEPRWPWALYAAAVGLLVLGQIQLGQDRFKAGLISSLAGLLSAVAGFVLPVLPWARLGQACSTAMGALAALRKEKGQAQRGGSSPSPRGPLWARLKARWTAWVAEDAEWELSRHWLLAPVLGLAAAMQWSLLGGSVVRASLLLVLLTLFLSVHLQGYGRAIKVPFPRYNLTALLLMALGLPFSAIGWQLLWQYKHVFTGWAIAAAGAGISLAVLRWMPFRLQAVETNPALGWAPEAQPGADRMALKLAFVTGALLCWYLARNVFGLDRLGLAFSATVAGILLLLASFPWFRHGLLDSPRLPKGLRAPLALALAGFGIWLAFRGQGHMDSGRISQGLWHFLAGAVALVLGLGHRPAEDLSIGDQQDGTQVAPPRHPLWQRRGEWALLALFTIAVFFSRGWNVDLFPWGAEGDEAGGGVFAMEALTGKVENPIITQNVPLHFFSVTAAFFKFFGLSIGVMRWHAVIFGSLSVIALYFFLRQFFGRSIGFLAALLMAASHWHLHYSRFGHYNAEQLLCQTVAFYFVFKGMRSGRFWHFFTGGAAFGLAILPALASRVLPFAGVALLLYFFVSRRDLLRRNLTGFLVFVVAAWTIAAPCLVYWARVIPLSMGRAQSVSIFDKTNTNAPIDTMAGFVSNVKVNMLMFNHYGDTRHRNNPLPSQKMLETATAALFALAFAYALYHWRDPLNFFLLTLFFINLAASIFSVEAPQSHRTAGNIPVVFSLIAIMLWDLKRGFMGLGQRAGAALFLAVMLPFFGWASWKAGKRYFVDARNLSYDVAPTYVALRAGQTGQAGDLATFFATGFAASHPPVLLFKQGVKMGNYHNIADYLPISIEPEKRQMVFLVDDYQAFAPWVRELYPKAPMHTEPNIIHGGTVMTWFDLSPEDIASITGLEGEAYAGGVARRVSSADLALPQPGLEGVDRLRVNGSLRLQHFGLYTLKASGRGDVSIRLNGQLAYQRRGGVVQAPALRLPRGLSSVQAEIRLADAQDRVQVGYVGMPHPARQLYSLRNRQEDWITKPSLFKHQPQGLYGRFYIGRDWAGDAVMEYVEPSVLAHWLDSPFTGAWSAEWKGILTPPSDGQYAFNFGTNGGSSEIEVNGVLVSRTGAPTDRSQGRPVHGSVSLKAGVPVPLVARFNTGGQSWMSLRWSRPGAGMELVPPQVLKPDLR